MVAGLCLLAQGPQGVVEGCPGPCEEGRKAGQGGGQGHDRSDPTGPAPPHPRPDHLHRDGEDQEHAQGSGQRGQVGRRGCPPPPRRGSGTQGEEAADREDEQGALCVAHDQGEGGRGQAEEPHRAARQQPVSALSLHQDPQQGGPDEGADVGHDEQGRTHADARQEGHHPRRQGDQGEEPERARTERGVPVTGDGLVPPGVPTEEPLVHASHDAGTSGVDPVHDDVGESQGPEHDGPGDQPRRQHLLCQGPEPLGPGPGRRPPHGDGVNSWRVIGS